MPGSADDYANAHAPNEPRPPSKEEEEGRQRQLVQAPRPLKETIEWVVPKSILHRQHRRALELKLAGELPEQIQWQWLSMSKEVVTPRLPLCPIALVVNTDDPKGSGYSNQNPDIDERTLKRLRAIKGAMDHQAVHAHAVADKQTCIGGSNKQGESTPSE
jgi:hypothetical protein